MDAGGLPEEIVARFRTLSLERVGRIEAAWQDLVDGTAAEDTARLMRQDLHTMKGDSRAVSFADVNLLCQKLEELVELAAELNYDVPEDFDLVVTMATQFLGLLLRKKTARSMGGIDLAGFVRQVEEVLQSTRASPAGSAAPLLRRGGASRGEESADRISETTRARLAAASTRAFIEYESAAGSASRARLRELWVTLRDELARLESVPIAPLIERQRAAAVALGESLGKRVELELELGEIRLGARAAEALDLAVVHLVRNAVDHGIDPADQRRQAGKPEKGTIKIRARASGSEVEVIVEDDGAGVEIDGVRRRAVECGLLTPERARESSEREILQHLFLPGFSTREETGQISGRGVGLDAVRSALIRVGGSVQVESRSGRGCRFVLSLPRRSRSLKIYRFRVPEAAVWFCVSASWTAALKAPAAPDAIDPVAAVDLARTEQSGESGVDPGEQRAMRLRWGFLEVNLLAASEPVLDVANRICPTGEDHPFEVVRIGGGAEALLLRPERLIDQS